jgi:5'-deoxynucleotidase YfbR-like HD superfamily hydrolase
MNGHHPDWKKFLINDYADVKRLDYVIRYSSIPSNFRESVSQHSFWVVLNSCLLNRELFQGNVFPELELMILKKALIHDIGECITGDLVRTFKYSNKDLKEIVNKSEHDMMEKYFPKLLLGLISETNNIKNKDDENYVNAIVKAADFISLFHYMNRQHNQGNREITPFINKMKIDLKEMSNKAKDGTPYGPALSELYKSMSLLATCPEEDRSV